MRILREEQIKKTRIFWLCGIVIGLLIIFTVSSFFIMKIFRERQYTQLINEAENYMKTENYDKAVLTYRSAIRVDEKKYRGYEGLSEVYIIKQQYSMARAVLKDGMEITGSKTLQYIYSKIENISDGISLEQIKSDLKSENNENQWNDSLISFLGNATYKQYLMQYESGIVKSLSNGCSIFYEQLGATLFFLNKEDMAVINGETGVPFEGQVPSYLVFDDLSVVFSQYATGMNVTDIQTIIRSEPELKTKEDRFYLEFEYLNCLFQIDCDNNGYVSDMKNTNKIFPLTQSLNEDMAEIIAVVIDATTGEVIEDVTVSARSSNNESEDAVSSAVSDGNGEVILSVPAGTYTLEFSKDGYVTEHEDVIVRSQTKENIGMKSLSPTLGEGEWRIVLEWGDTPADLDSHLVTDTFHISYVNPVVNQVASLDVDDTDGQGPETITINNLDMKERYEYYVQDFTNKNNPNSNALANSGATVKVYMPNGEISEYSVPNGSGTKWSVFTIENGTINVINQIQAE